MEKFYHFVCSYPVNCLVLRRKRLEFREGDRLDFLASDELTKIYFIGKKHQSSNIPGLGSFIQSATFPTGLNLPELSI